MMLLAITYIHDGRTGRLLTILEDREEGSSIDELHDGFVTVSDRHGQVLFLNKPVLVEEVVRQGNGGYTTVTVRWFNDGWQSTRLFTDKESVKENLAAAGFALQWNHDCGEYRVLTNVGERPITTGLFVALSSPLVAS